MQNTSFTVLSTVPHPRTNLLAAAVAATLSIAPAASPAHAQQSAVSRDDSAARDNKVQQVEVHGALDAYDPRRDDTAAKIVVNHDEIVRYGDTVVDVLKRVPGVTVSGKGGRGSEVRMGGWAAATPRS